MKPDLTDDERREAARLLFEEMQDSAAFYDELLDVEA